MANLRSSAEALLSVKAADNGRAYATSRTATQKEAATWIRLKNSSKVYPDSKLTRRLDNLSGLYLASTSGNNLVQQKIASNGFYRSQLGL